VLGAYEPNPATQSDRGTFFGNPSLYGGIDVWYGLTSATSYQQQHKYCGEK